MYSLVENVKPFFSSYFFHDLFGGTAEMEYTLRYISAMGSMIGSDVLSPLVVIKGIYKGEPITPTRVSLDAGDVFVFRADLVHAGGDYHSHNIRMHCYMDSPAVHRDPNRTFIISKHASEDVKKYICEVIS
jgi:hypothetical protein